MIGKTISHYKILEKLGSGGMGVVYKAEDIKLHRIVALKFLPPDLTRDEEAKKRFIHEAEAASSLEHNNICNIHEIGETENGQMFIVMSCYEGETLKKKIERGPLNVQQAINIITQLAEGIARAHVKEIIHRDIKPANIFITKDGVVKILDFGLAKVSGQTQLTQFGAVVGTAAYMSPEQLQGIKIDKQTDIWSLGVVFYEMLTGQLPFKGAYEQALLFSIMNEEPEFVSKIRSDVPREIENIINKALTKNPDKRYKDLNEIIEELQPVREDLKSGSSKSFSRIMGRKQRRLFYRTALITTVVITIAFYLWINYNPGVAPVAIALLPLDNISTETGQEWFSDGMTDALITYLAKISGLNVISRTSVMKFKDTGKSASDIAIELGVKYIIEGSILKISDNIKISIKIIDVSNDRYLWAQEYDREFKNIISLMSEVAKTIADQIKVQVTPDEQKHLAASHQVDPKAYELYLLGNFYWYKLTPQSLDMAMKYYKLAAQQDSQCALAYAGMALVWLGRAQAGSVAQPICYENSKESIKKAVELDSNLAEVRRMLAGVKAWWQWSWKEAEIECIKVINQNPGWPDTRAQYSHMLYLTDRPEEGRLQIEKAKELDPLNVLYKGFYAMSLMYERRYDEAIDFLEKTRLASPNEPIILHTLRSAYHQKKMYRKAIEIWRESYQVQQDSAALEALNAGYRKGGYSYALRSVAELFIKRSETKYVTPWQIATLYTRAGMKNEALNYFEKAYEVHDPNLPYLKIDPIFDFLKDDPRYKKIIKNMGL